MAVVVGTTLIAQPGGRLAGVVVVLLAAPLTAAFIRADRRAAAPLLPAAALAIPALRRGTVGAFLNTATTSSGMTLVTLYLQDGLHRSPLAAAATLVPFSLAVVAGSALAAPALRRISPERVLAIGLAVIAAALVAVAGVASAPVRLRAGAVGPELAACVATAGTGLGLGLGGRDHAGHRRPQDPARDGGRNHQYRGSARHRHRHRRPVARRGRHHRRPRRPPPRHRLGRRRGHRGGRSARVRAAASPAPDAVLGRGLRSS